MCLHRIYQVPLRQRHASATGASSARQRGHPHWRPVKLSNLFHGGELERGAPFCANSACALHVRLLDEAVEGGGNWLTLPDGRMFGRSRFGNTLLCDACATHRGPVRLNGTDARTRCTN